MIQVRCPLSPSFSDSEIIVVETEKIVCVYDKKEAMITKNQHEVTERRNSHG